MTYEFLFYSLFNYLISNPYPCGYRRREKFPWRREKELKRPQESLETPKGSLDTRKSPKKTTSFPGDTKWKGFLETRKGSLVTREGSLETRKRPQGSLETPKRSLETRKMQTPVLIWEKWIKRIISTRNKLTYFAWHFFRNSTIIFITIIIINMLLFTFLPVLTFWINIYDILITDLWKKIKYDISFPITYYTHNERINYRLMNKDKKIIN